MLAQAIRELYGYNRSATGRLLDAAANLTDADLHRAGVAGHGSVLTTLLHTVSAQRGWLSWWDGSLSAVEAYQLRVDPADYPDLAAVRAFWEATERQTAAFVDRLDDAVAASVYEAALPDGSTWRVPLWQMMLHVANHGTQHRSEVAAMLTGCGHSPDQLDLIDYFAGDW